MQYPFQALSLSYKTAPLAVREQLALDEAASAQLLRTLHHDLGLTEVLVLSTCNRTEVYYSAPAPAPNQPAAILAALGQLVGVPDITRYAPYFTSFPTAKAAAQHLFEVALGLDAQVVGDAQIIHQVKRAYQRSAAAEVAGPFLHRLLHAVFAAHKRVQQETAFREGAASTASATADLVASLVATVARPRVLLVGLGEIGADVARYVGKSKRFADVTVCNRTDATAQALAAECGLRWLAFADVARGVQEADVVVSAISAAAPFFTAARVAGLLTGGAKCFLDLSVPRSVAPEVAQLPGVQLYNLDGIQRNASAVVARRLAAVPHVRAILADSLATLTEWSRELRVSPTIQKLKGALEQLRVQEVERFQKNLSAEEAARLDEVTKSLTQKFLKLPVLQLKAACQRDEADELVTLLTTLFELEKPALPSGQPSLTEPAPTA